MRAWCPLLSCTPLRLLHISRAVLHWFTWTIWASMRLHYICMQVKVSLEPQLHQPWGSTLKLGRSTVPAVYSSMPQVLSAVLILACQTIQFVSSRFPPSLITEPDFLAFTHSTPITRWGIALLSRVLGTWTEWVMCDRDDRGIRDDWALKSSMVCFRVKLVV